MKIIPILFLALFLCFTFVSAEPTQQFNKIYLNPFYRATMSSATNYNYNVTINPPDAINSVVNAMIEFNIQINGQSQTFTLLVNGQSCNNPTYAVTTAFSTTGEIQVYFDCSNVITQAGTYNLVLTSAVNTGTITGWIDLTYMNNPKGELKLSGTEYQVGDTGTAFVQLLDTNKLAINSATCYLSSYYPNKTNWMDNTPMTYLSNSAGLFYKDFISPTATGTYMLSSTCYIPSTSFTDVFNDFSKLQTYQNVTIPSGSHYLTLAIPVNSTGYKNPANWSDDYNQWTNPQNAIRSDDNRATTSIVGEQQDWYNFSFSIPAGATIEGITVSLEGSTASGTTGVDVELSRRGGLNYTSTGYGYTTSSSTDAIRTFGNSTDLWGRTNWTTDDFNSTNFRIRLTKVAGDGINHRIDNILVNVSYLATPLTRGYVQSIDINLTGYLWKNFSATYSLNGGNISFEVRNQNNITLCTGLGDISVCANTTSPIRLYAILTTNGTLPSSTPTLDDWTLTWLANGTVQQVQGSGELHISDYVSGLHTSISNIQINNSAIAQAVWDYNGTINTNILSQFSNAVWTLFNNTYNFINLIVEGVWTRADRNLTYYPSPNNLTAQQVWEYSNRTLTYYDVTVINETSIALNVWNAQTRELTHYVINNISASDIWTYGTRDLTYYPTPSFNFTVNGTDIATQVWSYNGTINNNILNQLSSKVECIVRNLLAGLNGEDWGVDITVC